uniref:LCCL domain-containing protein n=1 Tax=Electrophorus electricus TaxID=8005 RepID=A0A4W4F8S2_ELEEL
MPLAVSPLTRARMTALALALAIFAQSVLPTAPWPSSDLHTVLEKHMQSDGTRAAHTGRTDITANDRQAILDLHNQLRAQVHPPASNMEYMVWDSELERMAEEWAETCMWEHGPASLLPHIGQNLGVHWGRYRPPTSHVQAWYDEVRDYSFPYPQECRPHCPFKCTGAQVCTHYTQLVWATSSRVGCAIHVCYDMKVGEQIWGKAVYLVCNYSPKGNWWGSAPYKPGASCSACPPSYGGVCKNSLCYRGRAHVETDENNSIEPEAPNSPGPHTRVPAPTRRPRPDPSTHAVVSTEQMCTNCPIITLPWTFTAQLVTCDTKLRDQCKGTPCNRYECPAGCVDSTAKVVGTVHYDMQSSICRVGLHSGVIDNGGGWLDITRQGRKDFFIKSQKHGVQIYCPPNCLREHSWTSRVIGTRTYLDRSSVCGAAVHAGVIRNELGGYVDVMPTSSRNQYISSYQNGMLSESLQNPPGAMAFRVFAVI